MRSCLVEPVKHPGNRGPRTLAVAAALLAITFAVPPAAVRTASATPLDLGGPPPTLLRIDSAAERWHGLFGPIRHRRPGYDYGYGAPPEYFATIGVGSFDPSDQPGSGLYLNTSVGSTLAKQVDLGLQLSWYHRSTSGSQVVRTYQDPAGNTRTDVLETGSVATDLVPIMATIRARFPVSPGVQPYVGGGVGWEWLTVDGTDAAGNAFHDDYDGFGAQILGGVNFDLAPEVGVYGEAVWNLSTPSANFFDPVLGATVHEEVGFNGVAGHAGLRFRF